MLYRSSKYTAGEKIYWVVVIILFNVLGLLVFLTDNYMLRKKKG